MIDLTQPGVYLRCPGGNVENVSDQQQVIKWAALNIGNDPCVARNPGVWDRQRMLYLQAGVPCFPWLHCRSLADINFLIVTANSWVSPAIGLNIEDVVDDQLRLDVVGPYVKSRWAGPVHMATLAWVQNSQGWGEMAFTIAALEIFPDESSAAQKPQDCIDHAFKEGLENVTLMFKTKNHSPSDYDMTVCHSLYTADDIPPTADQWKIWAAPTPCKKLEAPSMSLTPTQKKNFRQQIARFALVAEKYQALWHYSQVRPYSGLGAPFSTTHHNDCSSYVALIYYSAARAAGFGVSDPLNEHYSGWGNTQSIIDGPVGDHRAPKDKYRVGDIGVIGTNGVLSTQHTFVCRKSGDHVTSLWSSFGEESGPEPYKLGTDPRPVIGIYRHPALL